MVLYSLSESFVTVLKGFLSDAHFSEDNSSLKVLVFYLKALVLILFLRHLLCSMSPGDDLQLEDISQLLHTDPVSAGRDRPTAC